MNLMNHLPALALAVPLLAAFATPLVAAGATSEAINLTFATMRFRFSWSFTALSVTNRLSA